MWKIVKENKVIINRIVKVVIVTYVVLTFVVYIDFWVFNILEIFTFPLRSDFMKSVIVPIVGVAGGLGVGLYGIMDKISKNTDKKIESDKEIAQKGNNDIKNVVDSIKESTDNLIVENQKENLKRLIRYKKDFSQIASDIDRKIAEYLFELWQYQVNDSFSHRVLSDLGNNLSDCYNDFIDLEMTISSREIDITSSKIKKINEIVKNINNGFSTINMGKDDSYYNKKVIIDEIEQLLLDFNNEIDTAVEEMSLLLRQIAKKDSQKNV